MFFCGAFGWNRGKKVSKWRDEIFKAVYDLLGEDDIMSTYSAAWCLAWSGYNEADIIPYDGERGAIWLLNVQ